jgi:hypothetical protein
VECYAGEKDRVNQRDARNEKEKICLACFERAFSLNECKLACRLQRTIGHEAGKVR